MTALEQCLLALPSQLLARVGLVGVSGQMHGVVLWRSGKGWRYRPSKREAADDDADDAGRDDADGDDGVTGSCWFDAGECSPLITWEDGRCSGDFLSALPAPPPGACAVASGYGCATLLWLQRHAPEVLQEYDCAGTVQDFLVAALCDLPNPVTTAHNAASWGYYGAHTGAWDTDTLQHAGFPLGLLPSVVPVGSMAGQSRVSLCGMPSGAVVGAAFGDFQAAVYSCLERASDAVLNISTSAQLAYVLPSGVHLHPPPPSPPPPPPTSHPHPHASPLLGGGGDGGVGGAGGGVGGGIGGVRMEEFPFVGDRALCVRASLNGGNVLAMFVETLRSWVADLGLDPPEADDLYVTLNRLAGAIEDDPEPPPVPPPDPPSHPGTSGKQPTPDPELPIHPSASINPDFPASAKAPDPDLQIYTRASGTQVPPASNQTPDPVRLLHPGASTNPGRPSHAPDPRRTPHLSIRATPFGERASPSSLGLVSLSGACPRGLSLGHVWLALCRGLVENLARSGEGGYPPPLPPGVERVLAGGSALLRNEALARGAARALALPLVASDTVDSAVGAARLVWDVGGRGGPLAPP